MRDLLRKLALRACLRMAIHLWIIELEFEIGGET
jgi:hypothetical protein